ncbi:MAG: RecQ family ATP-dependent DNA helicase [Acidimicrobiales bacterium]
MENVDERALELLRRLTGQAGASFRPGQLEAIRALAGGRQRVLIVQRTGWGKSAVYFIATRLLRDAGSAVTLLVSPLLALMRNQIEAAQRMGVRAATINSSNESQWADVVAGIEADEVDLLLVSPERLGNVAFRASVLERIGTTAGLLVVDEAHCISDWGHDFRPDYRRIKRVLDVLPRTVPVLACTATANDRVVADVATQLGDGLTVFRGPLGRDGLALHVIDLEAPATRLAWLAANVPRLPRAGIVYCLTKRDADSATEWLKLHGIVASSYTADSDDREQIERSLLANAVDVVVATSALGMGFDKPDLPFVIHFQSPGSVITYYQQVGRAGRQLSSSMGVLLRGREDAEIQDWFITSAFPTADECAQVLAALEAHDGFMRLADLEAAVNVKRSRLLKLLKNLEVDGAIVAERMNYQRTPRPYVYDRARIEAITALRRQEQAGMATYGSLTSGCRMAFLRQALDDPQPARCGVCDLCAGPVLDSEVDPRLAAMAAQFLRRRPLEIEPRKNWPDRAQIPLGERIVAGRALCRWGDGGWSDLVQRGKQVDGRFDDDLVDALAALVRTWRPDPRPEWIPWVPSLNHPDLVASVVRRLATLLGLPAVDALVKTRPTAPQKTMQNSSQQLANVVGAFGVTDEVRSGPVLLIDDVVDSRWTMTHVGRLLRRCGCEAVLPLALADTASS